MHGTVLGVFVSGFEEPHHPKFKFTAACSLWVVEAAVRRRSSVLALPPPLWLKVQIHPDTRRREAEARLARYKQHAPPARSGPAPARSHSRADGRHDKNAARMG